MLIYAAAEHKGDLGGEQQEPADEHHGVEIHNASRRRLLPQKAGKIYTKADIDPNPEDAEPHRGSLATGGDFP